MLEYVAIAIRNEEIT